MLFRSVSQSRYAKITEAVATLDLYFNKSVGIGEHSDILEELKKYTDMLDDADSKLNTLRSYFNNDGSSK